MIQQEVASCVRCPQLSDDRTNTVFGSGDPQSRLVFIGEGPGEDEDASGLPFQGAAGDMFDRILLACGLKREQVYLLNTIKCRPPKNRNPKATELENCWSYGQRQLDIIQPEFICCMGSVAARTLLNTNLSIGKLRKRFHSYRGSKVLVTYHPTYLLRTSSAKTHAWEDMKMLMNEMGIKIPQPVNARPRSALLCFQIATPPRLRQNQPNRVRLPHSESNLIGKPSPTANTATAKGFSCFYFRIVGSR